MLKNIKSKYIMEIILNNIRKAKLLKLIKYNKILRDYFMNMKLKKRNIMKLKTKEIRN